MREMEAMMSQQRQEETLAVELVCVLQYLLHRLNVLRSIYR